MRNGKISMTDKPAAIPELSQVRLLRQVGPIAEGNVGTVVHVYPRGDAYEVEFRTGPEDYDWHLETCPPDALEALNV